MGLVFACLLLGLPILAALYDLRANHRTKAVRKRSMGGYVPRSPR